MTPIKLALMLYFFMVAHKAACQTLSKTLKSIKTEEVLPVLEIFLSKDSQVEYLLCGSSSCSEACLFFSNDLLRLQLQPVQYDLQHDLSLVANEADRSVVLALLQVAFLWKCNDQGLGQRVCHVCQILSLIVVREVIILHLRGPVLLGRCQLQLTSISSMIVLQTPLFSLRRMVVLCVCLGTVRCLWVSLHWSFDCAAQCSTVFIGSVSLVLLLGILLNGLV